MAYLKVLPVGSLSHLKNLMEYTMRENKTMDGELLTFFGCQKESCYEDWRHVQKQIKMNGGLYAHQMIQSFPKGSVTPRQAHNVACELAEQTLTGYQYFIATHVDNEIINSHIVFNSVNYYTGYKYHSNKASLAIMRDASNKICRIHGLPIITEISGYKGIDKTTYEMARKGESWKVKLVNDLDQVLGNAHSKADFISFLEKLGYEVKWQNKNISVRKIGEKKSIRLDTLALQFGIKYTKNNIERALQGLSIDNTVLDDRKKQVPIDETKSEWQRYEKFEMESKRKYFSFEQRSKAEKASLRYIYQLKQSVIRSKNLPMLILRAVLLIFFLCRTKKQYHDYASYRSKTGRYKVKKIERAPLERYFGNVPYDRLTRSYGDNVTLKIPPEQISKFEGMDIFFSGTIRSNGNVYVTFKKSHEKYVSQKLGIDIGAIKTYGEIIAERFRYRQLKANNQGESVMCTYYINRYDLEQLDNMEVPFAYFRKGDKYKILFYDSELEKICTILGKDYEQEKTYFKVQHVKKQYAALKHTAQITDQKVLYRVVDYNVIKRLSGENINFVAFPVKGKKYNLALLEQDITKYENILQNREYQTIKGIHHEEGRNSERSSRKEFL